MNLQARGWLLLFSPAILVWLLGSGKNSLILSSGAVVGVMLLLVGDAFLGVRRGAVSASRRHPKRVPVGRPSRVELILKNHLARRLKLVVRDGVPETLGPERFQSLLSIEGSGRASVNYVVQPTRRGQYRFDGCWLQVPGPLGFTRRILEVELPSTLAVIPDIRLVRLHDLLAKKAAGGTPGHHPLLLSGDSGEVARLREYVPGDDPRLMDWKATARRLRPMVRELEAERNRIVLFVVDAGRWMGQPVDALLKVDHVLNAVLLASHVADRKGDQSAVLVFSDRILAWLPPGRGRAHQRDLLEALHKVPVDPVEPDFELAFRHLTTHLKKRSLAILFSDFSDPVTAGALQHSLPVLSRRHRVLSVHILDPSVEALVGSPVGNLRDLSRRVVAEELARERRLTLERLRTAGVAVLSCKADGLPESLLGRYMGFKSRGLI